MCRLPAVVVAEPPSLGRAVATSTSASVSRYHRLLLLLPPPLPLSSLPHQPRLSHPGPAQLLLFAAHSACVAVIGSV